MKKTFLFILAGSFLFSSCDKLKEKKFSMQHTQNFEINITETDPLTFAYSEVFSSADDEDVKEYLQYVKSYKIVQLSAKVWEYEGPATAQISGWLCWGKNDSDDVCHFLDVTKMNELLTSPERVVLDYSADDLIKMESVLLQTNEITAALDGIVTEKPMKFIFQLVADIDVVVEKEE